MLVDKGHEKIYANPLTPSLEPYAALQRGGREIQEGLRGLISISEQAQPAWMYLTPRIGPSKKYDRKANREAEQRLRGRKLETVAVYIAHSGGIELLASIERDSSYGPYGSFFDEEYSEEERRGITVRVIEIELEKGVDEKRRSELEVLKEKVEAIITPSSPARVK